MIGASEQPALEAKAAESQGLYKQSLAKLLWESTKAALSFEMVLKTDGRLMTRPQVLEALSSYKRFLVLYEKAGGPILPKCHAMYHLTAWSRATLAGAPRTFNAVVAKVYVLPLFQPFRVLALLLVPLEHFGLDCHESNLLPVRCVARKCVWVQNLRVQEAMQRQ